MAANNVALIPARGGSKRIPRKNIKHFHGKPIIAYSIEAAVASECFDKIIVSTDDEEIATVARQYGAETPFMRPDELSDDFATTMDVIKHGINWLAKNGQQPENICCIYATAPFIQPEWLKKGLSYLTEAEYAFPVTSFPFPIQRAVKLNESGGLEMFSPEHLNTRSQDLDEAFHDAGQFYWGKCSAFLQDKPLFSQHAKALIIPRKCTQDIDTPEDWEMAEHLYSLLHGKV
ncbi:pseudaminic acid cytidylyltransferase [Bermanella sp. R86510]|uniref:pseudaminic acid cytidylyltransferase n=1 Tax=unclassified Bermanella TaxID=2627862 RepID=UPI0037CC526C